MAEFISVPFEEEMTQEEIEALIEARVTRDLVYRIPFVPRAFNDTQPLVPVAGQVSTSTWTNIVAPPGLGITQTTPGANKIAEYIVVDATGTGDAFWETTYASYADKVNRLRCFVGPYQTLSPSTTSYSGIEMGSLGSTTPFPENNADEGFCFQLRHKRMTDNFELFVSYGTGTPVNIPLAGAPALDVHGCMMELRIDFLNEVIYALVDDVVYAQESIAGRGGAPGVTSNGKIPLFGILTTSGDNVATAQCVYSAAEYIIENYKES